MGRFRSFLRRVARPAAMFGVVGVLASMLIISTPSNAHAFRDLKAAETFVMGATKTIAPAANVAMAAASFTPVGFGVRILQLGFLAYSTSDIWMPIVAGAFGEPENDVPHGNNVLYAEPGFRVEGATISGNTITGNWSFTPQAGGTTGGFTAIYSYLAKCQRTSDGYTAYTVRDVTQGKTAADRENPWTFQFALAVCPTGWTTKGYMVGGGGGSNASGLWGPPSVVSQTGVVSTTASVQFGGNTESGSGTHGTVNVVKYGDFTPEGFDPYGEDVKYKVKNECIDASGAKSTIEAESSGDMIRLPSCEAAGKGHGTGKTSITGFAPGTTVEQPLWDTPAAPSDPATPLCDAARPTGGCTLSVELDGKPCEAGNPECENWAELQKNDPNNTRLKCRFGPYTLPMAACAALEKAYFPGGAPATNENTDGDPATQNWNDPRGNPIPVRPPTSTTQTAPVPGSSGQTAPGADPQTRNCFPVGWAAFNPVEWVLKPVRCAFEPSQDLNARNAVLTQKAEGKAPISFITNLSMTGPSNGGCPSWNITIPGMGSKNVVCESSFTAAIQSVRVPLFGLVATAMVWPLLRSIWYAAIPVLRVTPSSGGK